MLEAMLIGGGSTTIPTDPPVAVSCPSESSGSDPLPNATSVMTACEQPEGKTETDDASSVGDTWLHCGEYAKGGFGWPENNADAKYFTYQFTTPTVPVVQGMSFGCEGYNTSSPCGMQYGPVYGSNTGVFGGEEVELAPVANYDDVTQPYKGTEIGSKGNPFRFNCYTNCRFIRAYIRGDNGSATGNPGAIVYNYQLRWN